MLNFHPPYQHLFHQLSNLLFYSLTPIFLCFCQYRLDSTKKKSIYTHQVTHWEIGGSYKSSCNNCTSLLKSAAWNATTSLVILPRSDSSLLWIPLRTPVKNKVVKYLLTMHWHSAYMYNTSCCAHSRRFDPRSWQKYLCSLWFECLWMRIVCFRTADTRVDPCMSHDCEALIHFFIFH